MNYPGRILKEGEKDASIVKLIKQKLGEQGCGTLDPENPNWGAETTSCIKMYQSRHTDPNGHPLLADGTIGQLTWDSLLSVLPVAEPEIDSDAARLLAILSKEVGTVEIAKDSNRGPVEKYLKAVDCPPGNPYCIASVYWGFDQLCKEKGIKNPLPQTAGCLDHWAKSTGKKLLAKDTMENPSLVKPGMVAIMDFGAGHGHAFVVERVRGGMMDTLEGNTSPKAASGTQADREGGGYFRKERKINSVNKGFIWYFDLI